VSYLEKREDKLILKGNIHFDNVFQIYQKGVQLIPSFPSRVAIDLEGLQLCDSSSLALLTGWMRLSHSQNKSFDLLNVPAFLMNIIKVCGLEGVLTKKWEN